jgi:hypothetical protein
MKSISFLLLALLVIGNSALESISDDELVNIFKQETHLVVLFCKFSGENQDPTANLPQKWTR